MGVTEILEGVCGLGGHLEKEMEVGGGVEGGEVEVPSVGNSLFAWLAVVLLAGNGVTAPPVRWAADQVIGGDEGYDSFSGWRSFQREGLAAVLLRDFV